MAFRRPQARSAATALVRCTRCGPPRPCPGTVVTRWGAGAGQAARRVGDAARRPRRERHGSQHAAADRPAGGTRWTGLQRADMPAERPLARLGLARVKRRGDSCCLCDPLATHLRPGMRAETPTSTTMQHGRRAHAPAPQIPRASGARRAARGTGHPASTLEGVALRGLVSCDISCAPETDGAAACLRACRGAADLQSVRRMPSRMGDTTSCYDPESSGPAGSWRSCGVSCAARDLRRGRRNSAARLASAANDARCRPATSEGGRVEMRLDPVGKDWFDNRRTGAAWTVGRSYAVGNSTLCPFSADTARVSVGR